MKRTVFTFLLLTSVAFGIGACGSGDSGVPSTLGGVCNDMGAATCKAATKCTSGAMTSSQCVSTFVSACCGNDGTCGNATPKTDTATYQQCKDALSNLSCTDVTNGTMPSACNSL
jgi:hypothetical protein